MNKKIWGVIGTVALVTVLGLMVVGSASAAAPWWTQDGADGQPPFTDPNFECPADCPFDGQPQGRWNQDTADFVPGQGMMGQRNEDADGYTPSQGMMRGWSQDSDSNSDWMGRWNQRTNDVTPQRGMGYRSQPQGSTTGPLGGRWAQGNGGQAMPWEAYGTFGSGMMGRWNQQCDGDCEYAPQGRAYSDNDSFGQGSGRGWMMR